MKYKTEVRLVYGGLLIVLLVFARIVGGWYGVFERHSPERALAAEIEKEINFDVLFVSYDEEYFENKTIMVHLLITREIEISKMSEFAGLRSPSAYYVYRTATLNSGVDGKLHDILDAIGFVICLSADECAYRPIEKYVGSEAVESWWFGYEKGSQLWVKSDRNILVILEKLFKPEVNASEQSVEETD